MAAARTQSHLIEVLGGIRLLKLSTLINRKMEVADRYRVCE